MFAPGSLAEHAHERGCINLFPAPSTQPHVGVRSYIIASCKGPFGGLWANFHANEYCTHKQSFLPLLLLLLLLEECYPLMRTL